MHCTIWQNGKGVRLSHDSGILRSTFFLLTQRPRLLAPCHTRILVHSARSDSGCVGVAIAERPLGLCFLVYQT